MTVYRGFTERLITVILSDRKLATFHRSYQVDQNGCWLWQKALYSNGYAKFAIAENKHALAHRVSFQLHCGELPHGLAVCHKCDIRHCVNPCHLFLGTQRDNIQDAKQKGRLRGGGLQGEKHPSAKLAEREIPEIVRAVNNGMSKQECARRHGVSGALIGLIIRGHAWKHVPR